MKRLVAELRAALPAAFERDDYRARREAIEQQFKERSEHGFGELQHHAEPKHHPVAHADGAGAGADARRQGVDARAVRGAPVAERERVQRDMRRCRASSKR